MSRDETAVWTSAGVETPPPGSNETSSPSAREIVLTFRSGPLRGRSFEFTGLRRITLGRSSECDVAVFDNEVSRQHCTITVGPESIVVKDLGSSNGTFVDGKRVGLATLESGAIVRLASIELRFEVADAAEQTVVGDRPGRLSARARELAQLEIPGYTLGRLLGEGATGVVFEARDDAGAAFAIKVFEGSETLARGERRR
ncbi:MAG: FHA domain-containing protein, partial [Planctomycetota bacterium]